MLSPNLKPVYAALLLVSMLSCQRQLDIEKPLPQQKIEVKGKRGTYVHTFKTLFLQGDIDTKPIVSVTSEAGNSIRYLLSFKQKNPKAPARKYLLIETNKDGRILNSGYIISKRILTGDVDLYSFQLQRDTIIYYESTLYPNYRYKGPNPIRQKLIANIVGEKYDANTALSREPLPCENASGTVVCIDWYWVTYNADTGEIISEIYLYTTCDENCGEVGGGGNGGEDEPEPADIYICASSFNFQLQGAGSITNEAKTWGIIGSYIANQSTYTTTFGIVTYAPTDVERWSNEWSNINWRFYYLVLSGGVWLQPDPNGVIHRRFSARAHKEIAAAAADHASDNTRNPKSVLSQPGGGGIYKNKFKQLYTEYMRDFIPGTTTNLLHNIESGCAIVTYSSTPC